MGKPIHHRDMGDVRVRGNTLDSRLPTDPQTMVASGNPQGTRQGTGTEPQGKEIDAMGSSYKLWNKRLDGGVLTRGQITQFCNAIAAGYHGYYIGGHKTNLTPEECRLLGDKFRARVQAYGGYRLTPDHTEFGIEWLRRYPKRAESVGVTANTVAGFLGFRMVGWRVVRDNGVRASIIPVYRVISRAGNVDYSWSPWIERVNA
jgi:hypothetical protein